MKSHSFSLCLLLCMALVFSCKKSADTVSPDGCQVAGTRAQAFSDALKAYTTAQTPANCQAYKTAATSFINAAASCTTVSKADLDDARKELADLKC